MLHSKCLKCLEREADGVLTLTVTKKGEKIEIYCKLCELEVLYEMAGALDVSCGDVTEVHTILEERQAALCNDSNTR